jgi:heme/copper-type cytochrome/quinol oxidase subunit 2
MSSRNRVFLGGGVIVTITLLVVAGFMMFQNDSAPAIEAPSPGSGGANPPSVPETPPVFSSSVPDDAVPTVSMKEAPAAPGAEERSKTFLVQVSEEGYDPSVITVHLGDLVRLDLTARGGEYDFIMPYSGLSQRVKSGETKPVSFQATTVGTFDFMCREYCPSSKVIQGKFIVLPR